MPRKKQPKFKVGDVVKYNDHVGMHYVSEFNKFALTVPYDSRLHETRDEMIDGRIRYGGVGVIIEVGKKEHQVEWFKNRGYTNNFPEELRLCEGNNNTTFCDTCKHKFQCWTSRGGNL